MAGIIAFNNYLRGASVVSEATISGFPFANCVDGRTSTTTGFATGATRSVVLNFGSSKSIGAIGFARSNLFARGATLTFAGSADNVSYTDFSTITPAADIVRLQTLGAPVSYQYVRVSVSGHSGDVYVSDIYAGDYLALPSNVDRNFAPPEYSDNDEIISNLTYTNDLAGLIIQPKLKNAQFKFDTIETTWIDEYWPAFSASIKRYPFYWIWKTGKRAFYCWPEKSIGSLKYSSDGKFLSVSFKVEGITQ